MGKPDKPSFEQAPEIDALQDVIYTAKTWGVDQVRTYMTGLDGHMELMAVAMTCHIAPSTASKRAAVSVTSFLMRNVAERRCPFVFHRKMSVIERLKKQL